MICARVGVERSTKSAMVANEVPTVGVVVFRETEVLLVCHGSTSEHVNNTYGLPAGRIEEHEITIHAAQRELFEETGLTVQLHDLEELPKKWHAVLERKNGVMNFSLTVFIAKAVSGMLRSSSETTPVWVRVNELPTYNVLPNVLACVEEARAHLNKPQKIA